MMASQPVGDGTDACADPLRAFEQVVDADKNGES
jgi:hypothetical protein